MSPEEWEASQSKPSAGALSPEDWDKQQSTQVTKPTEEAPKKEQKPFFDQFKENLSTVAKKTADLATDIADIPLSTPAWLGGVGAGLVAAEVHAVDPRPKSEKAGTHFGAALAVSEAVNAKYGSPARKFLTSIGLLGTPKEGEDTSIVATGMGKLASAIHAVGEGVKDLTGSEELGHVTEFGTGVVAPVGIAKGAHIVYKAAKSPFKAPIATQIDPDTHVKAWQEQLEATPPSIKSAALRNKETGKIEDHGAKHSVPRKEATKDTHDQGFIDEQGNFLDRKEALVRAVQTGQIPEGLKLEFPEDGLHSGDLAKANDPSFQVRSTIEERPVTEAEQATGRSKLGFYDHETNTIVIDPEAIRESYNSSSPTDRPWIKEKINSPEEYQKFLLYHEQEHAKYPRNEAEDRVDYEGRINSSALKRVYKDREEAKIPRPEEVGGAADFHTKGMKILKEQGPEAAAKFARDTIAYKRNMLDLGKMTTPEDIEDTLYRLGKNAEADRSELAKLLKEAEAEGVDLEMKKRWREHAEGIRELDQTEQALFNKYYKPLQEERKALIETIQRKGWVPPTELAEDVAGVNVARLTVPKQLTTWERFKEGIIGNKDSPFDPNIEKTPGGAQERGLFVLEFPNGRRQVIQFKGNTVYAWINGAQKKFHQSKVPPKVGQKLGSGIVKEARETEIEAHAPYQYNKDSQAVLYKRVNELREFVRTKQVVENLKTSPIFDKIAHKTDSGSPPPEGFVRPKDLDKLPEFDGYTFEPTTAAIIEDFARVYEPNMLTKLSGALVKNMMLNPLPHMMNEGWHLYNARGLTGWVTPAGISRFVKTGVPALQEVVTQGPQFRSMLRDGASLLSADTRNNPIINGLLDKGMKEFIASPEGKQLAIEVGMKPVELYNALSKKSNKAMWVTRDIMYMQLVNEKMLKGMSQKEAIKEVERHMPAYRLPTKVMGSRALSKVLQNPNVTVFSRYHYGMLKSLKETALDLSGKKGKAAFLDGADTAVAIAVALAVLYPLQDMAAQALTGNPDAIVRRAGPYHPLAALYEIHDGEKDPQAFLASIFTFNPVLLAGAQLVADRKLYNGQPIYSPTDDASIIAKDVGNYVATQVPQVQTSLKVSDEKTGGGFQQWAAQQLDIKSPSAREIKRKEMVKRKKLAASRKKHVKAGKE